MAKKKLGEYDRFMALTDAQKDAEVAVYDRYPEGISSKPLRESDKALHRLARAKGRAAAHATLKYRQSVPPSPTLKRTALPQRGQRPA